MAQEFTAKDWAKAGSVPATGLAAGAVVGYALAKDVGLASKAPWFAVGGAVLGFGLGLAINWDRGCQVCRQHLANMLGRG